MKPTTAQTTRSRKFRTKKAVGVSALSCAALIGMLTVSIVPNAFAAEPKVDLGAAGSYSVLGGTTVTNTGETFLQGDLGVSPGTEITGFAPGSVLGSTHAADANAALAQSDLATAYNDAASRTVTESVIGDIGGRTFAAGVYKSESSLGIDGNVILDAKGDPSAVWIFQVGSTLTTGSDSAVTLVNGASACNVYWQVGSSATLGTASNFRGSILALTSITVNSDSAVEGRMLARNGAVTLDHSVFVNPFCATEVTPTPPPTTVPPTPTPDPTVIPTPTDPATTTPTPTDPATPAPTVPETPAPVVTTPTTIPTDTPAPSTPSDASGAGAGLGNPEPTASLTDAAQVSGADTATVNTAKKISDKELAATGATSIPLLTGLAVAFGLLGALLLLVTPRLNFSQRRH